MFKVCASRILSFEGSDKREDPSLRSGQALNLERPEGQVAGSRHLC
jgi:hypothetical protein